MVHWCLDGCHQGVHVNGRMLITMEVKVGRQKAMVMRFSRIRALLFDMCTHPEILCVRLLPLVSVAAACVGFKLAWVPCCPPLKPCMSQIRRPA